MWGSITICIANLSLKVKWLICALETYPIELMSKWLAITNGKKHQTFN